MSYAPTPIPSDAPPGLRAWLAQQLRQIADALSAPSVAKLNLQQLNAAPTKISDGDVVYADGTNWNPGSGKGVYARFNNTWNLL